MSQLQMDSFISRKKSGLQNKRTLTPFQRRESRREKLSRSSLESSVQLAWFELSVKEIVFYYNCNGQTQHLVNRELKLSNKTGVRVGFKIKCNNPQNYQVSPVQEKVEEGASASITIKLVIQSNVNALKFNSDKFQVEWGRFDESNSIIYSGRQILPVVIRTENTQTRNLELVKSFNVSRN